MPDIFDETKTEQPAQKNTQQPKPAVSPQSAVQAEAVHLWSTFTHHPKGISFAQKNPDEEVILFLRRAFITNLSWISLTIVLCVLPVFVLGLLRQSNVSFFSLPLHFPLFLLIFYYLLVIGYALANFITWFYNLGIVTEKRVLDVAFTNITAISVAATAVGDMRDVEYSQKSFAESFFDYGDVTIIIEETPQRTFVFEKAPHPAQVVDIISKLIHGDTE
jgi:hypothetical protein